MTDTTNPQPQPIATESFTITVYCSNCCCVYEREFPRGTQFEQSWSYDGDLLDVTGRKPWRAGEPWTPPTRIKCSRCGVGQLTRRQRSAERSEQ